MNALESFYSLDETIRGIKDQHTNEIRAVNDKLMASEIELSLTKAALVKALTERDQAQRIAVKLITQFALVEKVFAEAKALALSIEENPTPVPENQL